MYIFPSMETGVTNANIGGDNTLEGDKRVNSQVT